MNATQCQINHTIACMDSWARDKDIPTYTELLDVLADLTARCDGADGVRADGSNIDTLRAHSILDRNAA